MRSIAASDNAIHEKYDLEAISIHERIIKQIINNIYIYTKYI